MVYILHVSLWELEQIFAAIAKTFKLQEFYMSELSMFYKTFACAH